jgi:hypothetical protein
LRRLLIGNSTTILGEVVVCERGIPQGGALCPFLCQAFMDTLVCRLEAFATAHNLVFPWPVVTSTNRQTSARFSRPPGVPDFYLTTLLYADDVTLTAATPEALQLLLDEAHRWSQAVGINFSA